ncbi:hypothetical protein HDU83_009804 [Entophlyctis luteolus]|nr:hypothetical protein HDU83_009804 [Entophlyctis luteolus]
MDAIRANWEFMTATNFNAIPFALALMDSTRTGMDLKKFYAMHERLEQSMDLIVNDYHQAFNDSIQTFSTVVENIADSHKRVSDMKEELEWCKELLQSRKYDVFPLWVKSIQFKEMMHILETIEMLQSSPEKIESLISGKYHYMAVSTLISALDILNAPEFAGIGALSETHNHLEEVFRTLHETLIEELNNHIYLKTPYGVDRSANPENFHMYSTEILKKPSLQNQATMRAIRMMFAKIDNLQYNNTFSQEFLEDLESNPELDSYKYIKTIIQSLKMIGRLPEAVNIIRDRISLEFYHTVERTIQEVDQRLFRRKSNFAHMETSHSNAFDLIGLSNRLQDAHILRELLCTLFEKFELIIEGHEFVLGILHVKVSETECQSFEQQLQLAESSIETEVYTMHDVWNVVQNEVKSLLYDYLTRTSRATHFESTIVSINEDLKENRTPLAKGRLSKLTTGRADEAVAEYLKMQQLQSFLKSSDSTLTADECLLSSSGVVDKYATTESTGHRLLIRPDPYNVLIAFKPTMNFVERMENAISFKHVKCQQYLMLITLNRTGKFSVFLNDFILNVFLPSMEEKVLEYFHNFVNGTEAFISEYNPEISPFPLMKSVVHVIALIHAMCRTLYAMPVHQLEFIRMIEMVLVKFYEKILAKYKSLFAGEISNEDYNGVGVLSAGWACEEEIVQLLLKNTYFLPGTPDAEVNKALLECETYAEIKYKKGRSFSRGEMIFDLRTLRQIAHMHHSLDWFIAQITHLRMVDSAHRVTPLLKPRQKDATDSNQSLASDPHASAESLPPLVFDNSDDAHLPLNEEMAKRVDSILSYYQEISETFFFALHVEIRCHALYYLDLAMREGTYHMENEPYEPDQYIDALNEDLVLIQEALSLALPLRKIRFVYDGLPSLVSYVLCMNLKYIKRINRNGVLKLHRNVESLQQSITNICAAHEKGLSRDLLQFMEANHGMFTFEEYKVVLDLIFHDATEDIADADVNGSKASYQRCLSALKQYFVNH